MNVRKVLALVVVSITILSACATGSSGSAAAVVRPPEPPIDPVWSGEWKVQCGKVLRDLTLVQNGKNLSGSFVGREGDSTSARVNGDVSNNRATLHWPDWSDKRSPRGHFYFEMAEGKLLFNGSILYGEDRSSCNARCVGGACERRRQDALAVERAKPAVLAGTCTVAVGRDGQEVVDNCKESCNACEPQCECLQRACRSRRGSACEKEFQSCKVPCDDAEKLAKLTKNKATLEAGAGPREIVAHLEMTEILLREGVFSRQPAGNDGGIKDALAILDASSKKYPQDAQEMMVMRGRLYEAAGQGPEAQRAYEEAIAKKPTIAAFRRLAALLERTKQFEKFPALCKKTRPAAATDDERYDVLEKCVVLSHASSAESGLAWTNAADVAFYKAENEKRQRESTAKAELAKKEEAEKRARDDERNRMEGERRKLEDERKKLEDDRRAEAAADRRAQDARDAEGKRQHEQSLAVSRANCRNGCDDLHRRCNAGCGRPNPYTYGLCITNCNNEQTRCHARCN